MWNAGAPPASTVAPTRFGLNLDFLPLSLPSAQLPSAQLPSAQLPSPSCYRPICHLLLTLASLIPSPAQRDGLTTQDTNGRRPTYEVIATALHIQRRQPDREAYQE